MLCRIIVCYLQLLRVIRDISLLSETFTRYLEYFADIRFKSRYVPF